MSDNFNWLEDIGFKADEGKGTFALVPKFLNTVGVKLVKELRDNLKDHNASGDLSSSIDFEVTDLGNGVYKFQLFILPYYTYVDKGRKAGKMPPEKPIMDWLSHPSVINRLKIGTSGIYTYGKAKNKGGHKAVSVSNESKLKSLAFLIRRKIGRFGTPATDFYSSVINKPMEEGIFKSLEGLGDKIMVEVFDFTKSLNK